MKTLSKFLIFLSAVFSCCACSGKPPKPPVFFPFAIENKGAKVETVIRIPKTAYYDFYLKFMFDNHHEGDRDRVKRLVGNSITKDGKLIEDPENPGVPLLLKLTVVKIENQKEILIFDHITNQHPESAYGAEHYNKDISKVYLNAGSYRVKLESLRSAQELKGTKIDFSIAKWWVK